MQIQVVGAQICNGLVGDSFFVLTQQGNTQGLSNFAGDLFLDGENIFQIPVVGLRPKVVTVFDVDQLSGDAHPVTLVIFAHTAFKDGRYVELFADAAQVLVFALEGERRGAPGDPQLADLGQDVE